MYLTSLANLCSRNTAQLTWDEAYGKAETALGGLSLEEKVGVVTGVGWQAGQPCVGNTSPVESIGFPSLCLQDGPLGVRYASSITAFTPAVQAAQTWDLQLIRERGQFHAEEARALGVHVLLSPVAGALGKIAEGGRNWEGWSPDPYLTGLAVAATIEEMQAVGVQATIKHYIANEQELNRETMSSNVDEKTMHELYLAPYYDAVKSGVAATMCSYNQLDGTWACENDQVMNKFLKEEMGYRGYIMTDWGAQHSTVPAAISGLDMSMPGSDYNGGSVYWGDSLIEAINNGEVPQARVDNMVTRILAAWYKMEQDTGDYPPVNFELDVQGEHASNVRSCARDGIVLLRNQGSILPLGESPNVAVIGSGAVLGDHANNVCVDKGCNDGALGMGWGSGSVEYPYFSAPYDAINDRVGGSATLSESDDPSEGAAAAAGADVALVFITADSGEGYITVDDNIGDRKNLDPWHGGNELVKAVAEANDNVIVVVHSVGAIIMNEILALPSVKGVVWAGLPSQESGNALVDVIFGDTNPNGKLVYTIAKSADDYNAKVVPGDDDYDEGVNIDYRHFDSAGIEPEFEFGFGLCKCTVLNSLRMLADHVQPTPTLAMLISRSSRPQAPVPSPVRSSLEVPRTFTTRSQLSLPPSPTAATSRVPKSPSSTSPTPSLRLDNRPSSFAVSPNCRSRLERAVQQASVSARETLQCGMSKASSGQCPAAASASWLEPAAGTSDLKGRSRWHKGVNIYESRRTM